MTATQPRVGEQRPGGRAARVRAAVLRATSELLTEVGYDALTFEDVAARAGVHKTTVYRRWPTKPELVGEAVRIHSAEAVPVPDTGSVNDDLRQLAREVVANISSDGGARRSRSIVAAAASSEELASTVHDFWAHRIEATTPIVERAIERRELPASTDPGLLIEAVVAPIWLRLLLTGEPIDDAFADAVTEMVLAGARNG